MWFTFFAALKTSHCCLHGFQDLQLLEQKEKRKEKEGGHKKAQEETTLCYWASETICVIQSSSYETKYIIMYVACYRVMLYEKYKMGMMVFLFSKHLFLILCLI